MEVVDLAALLAAFVPIYLSLMKIWYKLGRIEYAVFNSGKAIGDKKKAEEEWKE